MRRLLLAVALGVVLVACSSGGLTRTAAPVACAPGGLDGIPTRDRFSVLTLNTGHGRNTAMNQMFVSTEQTRANLDLIANTLDGLAVDVVALQEADGPSRWSGGFDHVAYLRERSSLACSTLGRHSESWLASYGTALLSRTALREPVSVKFPGTPPTTSKGFVFAELSVDTGAGVRPLTVVSLHLDFSRRSVRDRQVAILIETLRDVAPPLVIMGDMNSHWGGQRSHVRQLAEGLGLNAYEPDNDRLGTYKRRDGKRLDWILVSRDLEFVEHRVLSQPLSDHLAVYAELRFRSPGSY